MDSQIQDNTDTQSPSKARSLGINFTFMVIYLAGLSAFGSFVNDMYLPSLPSMTVFFHCSASVVQLGLTFGMVGLGVGQLVLGPISDHYGRKPILAWSIVLFIIAAVVSVFSPTIHFFLFCRLLQGLGASGGYFLARTIPADIYRGRQLAKTMALIGAINGFAPACAPVAGGILADHFTWKGVFWVLAAFGAVLLCFVGKLKETLPASMRNKGSLLTSFSAYATLLKNKRFMVHVLLKGSALGVLFAYISSAPFIIQTHFGFSQTQFGLIMGGNALLVVAGSMIALKFKVLKSAAFWGAVGLTAFTAVEMAILFLGDSFLLFEIGVLPILFCLGMIFTVGNTLAMNEGRADAGDASAVLGVGGYVFGAAVAPLVGIGNILHSTAIVIGIVSVIVLISAILTRRIPADLNN